jgi:predicted nucleic acid-binding protein
LRVLVDTSVWVDFLNGHPSPEREALANLLVSDHDVCTCGVVISEVFQGLRREKGRSELAELFREMTYLDPSGIGLYFRAAEVYRRLRERGWTIRSTIDCLIAVLAEETGSAILVRDRDLTTILGSGIVDVRSWPAERPSA